MTNQKLRWISNVRVTLAAVLVLCLTCLAVPALAARQPAADPHQVDQFMWGLAGQESGWNYYIGNPYSGAFGRYQVMPANWNSWARRYLGPGWHDESPLNQELVVSGKVTALYAWLGDWNRVAYWWLTGSTESNHAKWTATGVRYVRNVMSLMARAPKKDPPLPTDPAGSSGMPVNVGDDRVTDKVAALRDTPAGHRMRSVKLRPGQTFLVHAGAWGPKGDILWIRVTTAQGKVGWLNVRKTLPAAPPSS